MSQRITSTDFYKATERLQDALGVELTTNVWHKHYSIYTLGESGSCQKQIVSSDTARDAVDQIWACINALSIFKKEGDQ